MEPSKDGWERYLLKDFNFSDFAPGMVVLDVGCGQGVQLQQLRQQGCRAIGIDMRLESLLQSECLGLRIVQSRAEQIALRDTSVDGVVCKVVMPYTDEVAVFQEIARVLRAGGMGRMCYHGAGYPLRQLAIGPTWKHRVYGLRTLLNTWLYAVTGWRLPGFLGDTIYQSRRRLTICYGNNHLQVVSDSPARTFLGLPVFLYHTIMKME